MRPPRPERTIGMCSEATSERVAQTEMPSIDAAVLTGTRRGSETDSWCDEFIACENEFAARDMHGFPLFWKSAIVGVGRGWWLSLQSRYVFGIAWRFRFTMLSKSGVTSPQVPIRCGILCGVLPVLSIRLGDAVECLPRLHEVPRR